MHKWYVLQVFSTHEKKVKKAIEENRVLKGMQDLIDEVLLPVENVQEVKQGIQRVVERRIWPGYLLIKMDLTDESWSYVKETPGVIGFLGGAQPTALTDIEVEKTLKDLAEKKDTVTQKHKFKTGDHIKIIDGVFVNFIGTVTEVYFDKGCLSANVSIFGRETRVDDLDFSQIEEVSESGE